MTSEERFLARNGLHHQLIGSTWQ